MSLAAEMVRVYFTDTRLAADLVSQGEPLGRRMSVQWRVVGARATTEITWQFDAYTRFDAVAFYDADRLVHEDRFEHPLSFPPNSEWTHIVNQTQTLVVG